MTLYVHLRGETRVRRGRKTAKDKCKICDVLIFKDKKREYQGNYCSYRCKNYIEVYNKNVKHFCVICDRSIAGTFKSYVDRGNFCGRCSAVCGENAKLKGDEQYEARTAFIVDLKLKRKKHD